MVHIVIELCLVLQWKLLDALYAERCRVRELEERLLELETQVAQQAEELGHDLLFDGLGKFSPKVSTITPILNVLKSKHAITG